MIKNNRKFQVLLATMNQNNDKFLETMNISSDILVCNQNSKRTDFKEYNYHDLNVKWFDFNECGVGLNRNNALLRSDSEICLLADDDVIYFDNYENIIMEQFQLNPDADVILFNIISDTRKRYICKKKKTINRFNCGKFGAVRIAFRRLSVIKNNISFNTLFGGGCDFSSGEDVLFIKECLNKKLKVIAVPIYILKLKNDNNSSWFTGYNDKFFYDLGCLYVNLYGNLCNIFGFIQLIRKRKIWLKDFKFLEAFKLFKKGVIYFKEL